MYDSRLKISKTEDGKEIRQQEIVAERVVEQRVSHFLMGLAIVGTMTGPLLELLNLIPRALFGGVFFVVGVSTKHIPTSIKQSSRIMSIDSGAALKATALWPRCFM